MLGTYYQVNLLIVRYKSVNFGAAKSPGAPNWQARILCSCAPQMRRLAGGLRHAHFGLCAQGSNSGGASDEAAEASKVIFPTQPSRKDQIDSFAKIGLMNTSYQRIEYVNRTENSSGLAREDSSPRLVDLVLS